MEVRDDEWWREVMRVWQEVRKQTESALHQAERLHLHSWKIGGEIWNAVCSSNCLEIWVLVLKNVTKRRIHEPKYEFCVPTPPPAAVYFSQAVTAVCNRQSKI